MDFVWYVVAIVTIFWIWIMSKYNKEQRAYSWVCPTCKKHGKLFRAVSQHRDHVQLTRYEHFRNHNWDLERTPNFILSEAGVLDCIEDVYMSQPIGSWYENYKWRRKWKRLEYDLYVDGKSVTWLILKESLNRIGGFW